MGNTRIPGSGIAISRSEIVATVAAFEFEAIKLGTAMAAAAIGNGQALDAKRPTSTSARSSATSSDRLDAPNATVSRFPGDHHFVSHSETRPASSGDESFLNFGRRER